MIRGCGRAFRFNRYFSDEPTIARAAAYRKS
jgi:hypothetical protein